MRIFRGDVTMGRIGYLKEVRVEKIGRIYPVGEVSLRGYKVETKAEERSG